MFGVFCLSTLSLLVFPVVIASGNQFRNDCGVSISKFDDAIDKLVNQDGFQGTILSDPNAPAFLDAFQIDNKLYQVKPQVILQVTNNNDVIAAIKFAKRIKSQISVRSGGHGTFGYQQCLCCVTVDLEPMNAITINPNTYIATVQAGARVVEVAKAANDFTPSLWVTLPITGSIGIGGAVLGGGWGYPIREQGATLHTVVGATVVLANGDVKNCTVDANDLNRDLCFAILGAGGIHFGIATEFRIQMRVQPANYLFRASISWQYTTPEEAQNITSALLNFWKNNVGFDQLAVNVRPNFNQLLNTFVQLAQILPALAPLKDTLEGMQSFRDNYQTSDSLCYNNTAADALVAQFGYQTTADYVNHPELLGVYFGNNPSLIQTYIGILNAIETGNTAFLDQLDAPFNAPNRIISATGVYYGSNATAAEQALDELAALFPNNFLVKRFEPTDWVARRCATQPVIGCPGVTRITALGPSLTEDIVGGMLPEAAAESVINSVIPDVFNVATGCKTSTFSRWFFTTGGRCGYYISTWGGQMNTFPTDYSAFPHTQTFVDLVSLTTYDYQNSRCPSYHLPDFVKTFIDNDAAAFLAQLRPALEIPQPANYINYPVIASDYAQRYWGSNYPQLRLLKCKFDPKNFFTNDQPIERDPSCIDSSSDSDSSSSSDDNNQALNDAYATYHVYPMVQYLSLIVAAWFLL